MKNVTVPEEKPIMSQCAVYLCERKYTFNYHSANKRSPRLEKSQQLLRGASDHDFKLTPPSGSETLSANSTYVINAVALMNLRSILSMLSRISPHTGDSTMVSISSDPGDSILLNILHSLPDLGEGMDLMASSLTDLIRTGKKSTIIPGEAF